MAKANDIIELIEASPYTMYANDSGAKFWGNIGAGVLAIAKDTGRILVGFRSKYVNDPHMWGVIGGKLDDENPSNIKLEAKREFKEETGYSGSLQLISAFVFKTKGFVYHNFIGIIDQEFHPISDWETEKFEWVTLEELKKLKPKHFGLNLLLKKSKTLIQKWSHSDVKSK